MRVLGRQWRAGWGTEVVVVVGGRGRAGLRAIIACVRHGAGRGGKANGGRILSDQDQSAHAKSGVLRETAAEKFAVLVPLLF